MGKSSKVAAAAAPAVEKKEKKEKKSSKKEAPAPAPVAAPVKEKKEKKSKKAVSQCPIPLAPLSFLLARALVVSLLRLADDVNRKSVLVSCRCSSTRVWLFPPLGCPSVGSPLCLLRWMMCLPWLS
jgi:hypothetical protein